MGHGDSSVDASGRRRVCINVRSAAARLAPFEPARKPVGPVGEFGGLAHPAAEARLQAVVEEAEQGGVVGRVGDRF